MQSSTIFEILTQTHILQLAATVSSFSVVFGLGNPLLLVFVTCIFGWVAHRNEKSNQKVANNYCYFRCSVLHFNYLSSEHFRHAKNYLKTKRCSHAIYCTKTKRLIYTLVYKCEKRVSSASRSIASAFRFH